MAKEYSLQASVRSEQGKGASRRLRRENKVPAVIYGAGKDAESITLKHNELIRNLQEEAFYSQIITINFGDGTCDDVAMLIYPDGTEEEISLKDK